MPKKTGGNRKQRIFDQNYEQVLDFAEKHGHVKLPRTDPETRRLSVWLRGQKKRKCISSEEREKLDRLRVYGYMENRTRAMREQEAWNRTFEKLQQYKVIHGHLVMPRKETQLYGWVGHQRKLEKQGRLLPERKERLLAIGFHFLNMRYNKKKRFTDDQERKWDEMYVKLCGYKEIHGHCNVVYNNEEEKSLADWVGTQRDVFSRGWMDDNRKERLDALNFLWEGNR